MNEINSVGGGLTIGFDADKKAFTVNDTLADDVEVYQKQYVHGRQGYAIGAYNWIWQVKSEGK